MPIVNERMTHFVGGSQGTWKVVSNRTLVGTAIATPAFLSIELGKTAAHESDSTWVLRGVTSNERYVTRPEKNQLVGVQAGLGRTEATCAAFIPIKKSAAWWALTQDERRAVFEEQSEHIKIGLRSLPAVARRLHHCRDLSEAEPFDFLTWFEFAPQFAADFDTLVEALRRSVEWNYVEREVELRLVRHG